VRPAIFQKNRVSGALDTGTLATHSYKEVWISSFAFAFLLMAVVALALLPRAAHASPQIWSSEWPNTDFAKTSIDFSEIISGGPPKDGIPAIDDPKFETVETGTADLGAREPVVSVTLNGESKAYPLRILMWHEIVNDTLGGIPITVTYCPLCNSAIVFDRRLDGIVLDFGTTGKLRYSDLVMYDRQTESWWQQFLGQGIVGEMTGSVLRMIPSRVESVTRFAKRNPDGLVQVPTVPGMRRYGVNPYSGYDSASYPFLYRGKYEGKPPPLAYVIAVGKTAWTLDLLRAKKEISHQGLELIWTPGMNSALDDTMIAEGRDLGEVVVQRDGEDVVYDRTFAFAFKAFHPDGKLISE